MFCKSLFFSPNGNSLACGGFIWDFALGKVVSVKAPQSPFKQDYYWNNAALSPDLKIAVSTNWNTGIIKLWETTTGREIHTLSIEKNVWEIYISQFSPDGKIFASVIWLEPINRIEIIKLWEVGTGRELCTISVQDVDGENKYTSVIALSSDGRILASNSGNRDKTIIVLSETLTGKEICRFQEFGWQDFLAEKSVEELSVDKKPLSLRKFISSAFNKFLLIFCPARRKMLENRREMQWNETILRSLKLDSEFRLINESKKIVSLAFSPNDQLLASGDKTDTITLWQLNQGSLEPPTQITTFTSFSKEPIKTLAFSPDGQTLAAGRGDNDGGITLWNVKSGKKLETLSGHTISNSRACCNGFMDRDQVAVSPDGKTIASSGYNDMIKLWNTQTGSFLLSLESKSHPFSAQKITFSRDGKFLVSVNEPYIIVWEVSTGKEIQSIKPDPDLLLWGSRNLNQYGDLLAIVEKSTNFNSEKLRIKVLQVPNGETVCTLTSDYGFPCQIIFSLNKRLVATRHRMSKFLIWEIPTGTLIRAINTDYFEGDTDSGDPDPVMFSPDGKFLAIAGTKNITLWQVSSGKKISTINRYHQGWGSCLAFSPNGQTLAFTENTELNTENPMLNIIKLWDIKTRSEICILQQTLNSITSLDFSGNGQVLVSSYRDGTIKVWQRVK